MQELESNNAGWCDIRTAAKHTKMSVGFWRKAVRLKLVPFARIGSKAIRFRLSDLDRWIESNSNGGEVTYRKSEGR